MISSFRFYKYNQKISHHYYSLQIVFGRRICLRLNLWADHDNNSLLAWARHCYGMPEHTYHLREGGWSWWAWKTGKAINMIREFTSVRSSSCHIRWGYAGEIRSITCTCYCIYHLFYYVFLIYWIFIFVIYCLFIYIFYLLIFSFFFAKPHFMASFYNSHH